MAHARSGVLTAALLLAWLDPGQGGGALAAGGTSDLHPKYARVDGDIETVWQRPATVPKGIFFIAHGCQHQGTDIFSDVGPDGWKFEECGSSNFGRCLGLPEEVTLQRLARSRGYVVMAVSGGSGRKSCWHGRRDVPRVAAAIAHVRKAEELPPSTPILATGASSGGAFMGLLAASEAHGGLPNLKCIVPQIMAIQSEINRGVPTLFVHMPRDDHTAMAVASNVEELSSRNIQAAELEVKPVPVTLELLTKCLSAQDAKEVVRSLTEASVLDERGFLKTDARARNWVQPVHDALPADSADTLVPDESCLAELMNVATARHEFTAQFASQMLDFCEQKGAYAAPAAQAAVVSKLPSGGSRGSWKSPLGELELRGFGHQGGPLAIALHGMSSSPEVLHEWDAAAEGLSDIGYYVLIPNLHSNAKTKPGVVAQRDLLLLFEEVMKALETERIALLLGKSWGGGMAAGLATAPALHVEKLVLVAPVGLSTDKPWQVTCKTALFWAADDPVIPISTVEKVPGLSQHVDLYHKETSGGHRVLPAYIERIADFARESNVRNGEIAAASEPNLDRHGGVCKTSTCWNQSP